jgi:hypothetical protein
MFTVGVPFLAIMAVFAMRYGMLAFRARMNAAANEQYQALAQRMAAAQAETSASLATIKAQLADVSASLATVEKVLKQVG